MGYKTAVLLGLLPQLLSASVVCNFSAAANNGDTCQSFTSAWGQTVKIFEALNPGVSCPNLTPGQSYCLLGTVSNDPAPPTTTSTTLKTTTSTTTTSSSPYQPTQPGLVANCDKFHLVAPGDQDQCYTIEAKYGITEAQFMAWNPSIKPQCSNLWLGYYVCVHVPGATTTEPTPTGPEPQMPGIVSNCAKFYQVKSGDTCYTMEIAAGFGFDQFRSWNTQIDATCSNLWVDYYVCVGV
ncbi:hypothetical protein Asppvi_009231 [Aspergillus pseudoviridinutans]|uniref:LysM domain-containing protein n=1 Tax=Aspergillus pseudoviridinutans TaxID=1517512 RepID=A0A9P3EY87_9EURO|nr:uncharacterized protein Asppvi_009231 [Aspergillus pseudoviridinutans]GIJ90277.1 hypothetical protein Asppvi_009231 [Aspergillus pseudoviridinutans]